RGRSCRPNCRSNRRRGPRRRSLPQRAAGQRVEGRGAFFARSRSIGYRGRGAERVGQARGGLAGPPGRRVANLPTSPRSPGASPLGLVEGLGGRPAGCAVLLQALEQLAFGGKESFENLTQFLSRRLLLTGRLQRLAVLADLVANGQKLLAGRGRLLRRAE